METITIFAIIVLLLLFGGIITAAVGIRKGKDTTVWWGSAIGCLSAFIATGYLSGWLVGVSSSPVVAALLPLLFGILGAIGFGAIDRLLRIQEYGDKLEKILANLPVGTAVAQNHLDQLRSLFQRDQTSKFMPLFWSTGAIALLFCLYPGLHQGASVRRPDYDAVEKMFITDGDRDATGKTPRQQLTKVPPTITVRLRGIFVRCKSSRIPPKDVEALFTSTIVPLLQTYDSEIKKVDSDLQSAVSTSKSADAKESLRKAAQSNREKVTDKLKADLDDIKKTFTEGVAIPQGDTSQLLGPS
jgi:hypothetical protein